MSRLVPVVYSHSKRFFGFVGCTFFASQVFYMQFLPASAKASAGIEPLELLWP